MKRDGRVFLLRPAVLAAWLALLVVALSACSLRVQAAPDATATPVSPALQVAEATYRLETGDQAPVSLALRQVQAAPQGAPVSDDELVALFALRRAGLSSDLASCHSIELVDITRSDGLLVQVVVLNGERGVLYWSD